MISIHALSRWVKMSRLHRVCHTWHYTEACVPAPGSWGGLSSSPSHQRDAALRAHRSHRMGGPARYCQRWAHFWTTAESQMSTVLTGSIATKAYIPVFFCHHSQDKSLLSSVLFFFFCTILATLLYFFLLFHFQSLPLSGTCP